MVPQGAAGVFGAEYAATLQLRDHQLNEVVERAGQIRRHDVEAVGGFLDVPLLHHVGDLRGRTLDHQLAARAGNHFRDLPDCHVFRLGQVRDVFEVALAAAGHDEVLR